jgi:hypothetical protein
MTADLLVFSLDTVCCSGLLVEPPQRLSFKLWVSIELTSLSGCLHLWHPLLIVRRQSFVG